MRLPPSAVIISAGLRVVDARGEAGGGEAAEHHRVDRADARAGEDREAGLGDHRHVDDHPVAALDAQRLHHRRRRGSPRHASSPVGKASVLSTSVEIQTSAFCSPRACEVPVDRVVAEVGLAADEPLRERRPRVVEHPARTACASRRASPARPRSRRGRRSSAGGIPRMVSSCVQVHHDPAGDLRIDEIVEHLRQVGERDGLRHLLQAAPASCRVASRRPDLALELRARARRWS